MVTSVRQAVDQGRPVAVERRVELTSHIYTDPAVVLGDGEALRRLVFILIDNAIKYNIEGGTVQVELRIEGEQAVCTVSDSGIGVAKEDQQRIFDRFWRADKVRSRGAGGAGLGLSIARWIVERHQGKIDIRSELGKGATLTVRLPIIHVARQEE
jgi:signal transduction histidine kinase